MTMPLLGAPRRSRHPVATDRPWRASSAGPGDASHASRTLRELGAVEGDVASNVLRVHRFEKRLGQTVGVEVSKRNVSASRRSAKRWARKTWSPTCVPGRARQGRSCREYRCRCYNRPG